LSNCHSEQRNHKHDIHITELIPLTDIWIQTRKRRMKKMSTYINVISE
jgi:hypothetical protein